MSPSEINGLEFVSTDSSAGPGAVGQAWPPRPGVGWLFPDYVPRGVSTCTSPACAFKHPGQRARGLGFVYRVAQSDPGVWQTKLSQQGETDDPLASSDPQGAPGDPRSTGRCSQHLTAKWTCRRAPTAARSPGRGNGSPAPTGHPAVRTGPSRQPGPCLLPAEPRFPSGRFLTLLSADGAPTKLPNETVCDPQTGENLPSTHQETSQVPSPYSEAESSWWPTAMAEDGGGGVLVGEPSHKQVLPIRRPARVPRGPGLRHVPKHFFCVSASQPTEGCPSVPSLPSSVVATGST